MLRLYAGRRYLLPVWEYSLQIVARQPMLLQLFCACLEKCTRRSEKAADGALPCHLSKTMIAQYKDAPSTASTLARRHGCCSAHQFGEFCRFLAYRYEKELRKKLFCYSSLLSVPGMAQFLRGKVPPQVFTAKCSEPQAEASNGGGGGSGVAKPRSLRTETGYKAKRRVRLLIKLKPKG